VIRQPTRDEVAVQRVEFRGDLHFSPPIPEVCYNARLGFSRVRCIRLGIRTRLSLVRSRLALRVAVALELPYRGTSFIRKQPLVGHYRRHMPRVLGGSLGGERFLMGEVPLYGHSTAPSPQLVRRSAHYTTINLIPTPQHSKPVYLEHLEP